jgi:hypothetical protein
MLTDTLERIANLVEFAILLVLLSRDQRRQLHASLLRFARHRAWSRHILSPIILGAG